MPSDDFDLSAFDDGLAKREDLINHLKYESCVLSTDELERAFTTIDRKDFVSDDYKSEAYEDYALPIGHGATISQPTTVAFMLELLDVKSGDSVLDVGSGSGYTSALLGMLVGENGSVLGVDVVSELVGRARTSLKNYELPHVALEERASVQLTPNSFDRILVSASSDKVPLELTNGLKEGAVMVAVVGSMIVKGHREHGEFVIDEEYPGFVFVEYIE